MPRSDGVPFYCQEQVDTQIGHADPAFTLRVYAHLLPSSHDRARQVINDHFTRMHADADSRTSGESRATEQEQPDGTETEQRRVSSP
jgi:hypothetical protein